MTRRRTYGASVSRQKDASSWPGRSWLPPRRA